MPNKNFEQNFAHMHHYTLMYKTNLCYAALNIIPFVNVCVYVIENFANVLKNKCISILQKFFVHIFFILYYTC